MKMILYTFSVLYGCIISLRNMLYDFGVFSVNIIPKPVISIGNISAGGTGKTPVVEMLIEYLLSSGKKIAVISRGYKRLSKGPVIVSDGVSILTTFENSGDEPFQMAKKFPSVIVGVDSIRIRIAGLLCSKYDFDLILLDDAFQHRKIHRDLNILTINAGRSPFNDYILPAGYRRDELRSIERADMVFVTRNIYNNFDDISKNVKQLKNIPVIPLKYVIESVVDSKKQKIDAKFVAGKKVSLFCGIADPGFFEKQVESMGAVIVKKFLYADHHNYSFLDLNKIFEESHDYGADMILTTEKDFSRISGKIDSTRDLDFGKLFFIRIKALPESDVETFHKIIDEKVNETR
jgi:tetraacyldisaccharide 4'-kinase